MREVYFATPSQKFTTRTERISGHFSFSQPYNAIDIAEKRYL